MQEYRTNNKFRNGIILVVTFFIGAIAMFALIKYNPSVLTSTTNVTKTIKDVTVTETGIADAVEKVYDAVVTVETYKSNTLYATGTGFVYKDEDGKGYILTNNHVIESGDEIHVVFTNQSNVTATVVGSDKYADIAVLTVSDTDIISVASIGSSESARVGDTVFAVGAPIDSSAYSWSVTRGILSGKDRMVEVSLSNSSVSDWVMSVLQTDAAINSGNSGGPLANSNGEVIGITSMKLASSTIEGMGFAIPIEDALDYASRIESGDKIERPYLGVSMYNLSSIASKIKTSVTSGVYIETVEKDSPADKAGLESGDIIVKLNDTDISSLAYLKYQLYKHSVGDTITITYYRGSDLKTANVSLTKAAS
jgi:serine protease Do